MPEGGAIAGERAERPGLSLSDSLVRDEEAGTMSADLTDQERLATEEKITRLYHDLQAEAMNLNADGVLAFLTDDCGLGAMYDGEWFVTMASFMSPIREGYERQERLEEEIKELRTVALGPSAAVLTVEKTFTFDGKDGRSFTSPIVQTWVGAEVDGEWKFIHLHMSTPHQDR